MAISARTTCRIRQGVQVASLLFYLLLAIYALVTLGSLLSWELPLRFDPLIALSSMVAQRHWLATMLPTVALLAATLVLGRFWCGWLCPVGTLLDWTGPRRNKQIDKPSAWHGLKYGLLFITLFAALWGNLTLLVLDPMTIWMRGVATVVLPGFTWLVTELQRALYPIAAFREPIYAVDEALRGTWLGNNQSYFGVTAVTVGLLLAILAFNMVKRRAWCRYICPLGGLLSLTAKASLYKRTVSEACTSCGACAKTCPMGAIDPKKSFANDSGECVLCLDCQTGCPTKAITFQRRWHLDRGWTYDPTRRQVLGALGASIGGLALVKVAKNPVSQNIRLLRPPMVDEEQLLSACIRCGACFRICPSQGLQPSLTEAGLEGLGTPILVPRQGNCEFKCVACGIVCPTGAIPVSTPETKFTVPIGRAFIDQSLCIPWSGRGDCIVCQEMCPIPQKAISLVEREATKADGSSVTHLAPVVDHERCNGCGACERKCPIAGDAAIRVRIDPVS